MPPTSKTAAAIALSRLDPVLAGPTDRARIADAAAAMPLASGGCFECHLARESRVDLATRYLAGEQAAPSWPFASQVGETLTRLPAPRPPWLQNLVLELDLAPDLPHSPGIYFGPGNPPGPPPGWPSECQSLWAGAAWAGLLERLQSMPLADRTRETIAHALRLPQLLPETWIGYLGLFPVRRPNRVRIVIGGTTAMTLGKALRHTLDRPIPDSLAELLARPAPRRRRLLLDVDADVQATDGFGLEFSQPAASDWRPLLTEILSLTPQRTSVPALTEALLRWPGLTELDAAETAGSELAGVTKIVHRINHLKVSWTETGPKEVKAYLYYGLVRR